MVSFMICNEVFNKRFITSLNHLLYIHSCRYLTWCTPLLSTPLHIIFQLFIYLQFYYITALQHHSLLSPTPPWPTYFTFFPKLIFTFDHASIPSHFYPTLPFPPRPPDFLSLFAHNHLVFWKVHPDSFRQHLSLSFQLCIYSLQARHPFLSASQQLI